MSDYSVLHPSLMRTLWSKCCCQKLVISFIHNIKTRAKLYNARQLQFSRPLHIGAQLQPCHDVRRNRRCLRRRRHLDYRVCGWRHSLQQVGCITDVQRSVAYRLQWQLRHALFSFTSVNVCFSWTFSKWYATARQWMHSIKLHTFCAGHSLTCSDTYCAVPTATFALTKGNMCSEWAISDILRSQ